MKIVVNKKDKIEQLSMLNCGDAFLFNEDYYILIGSRPDYTMIAFNLSIDSISNISNRTLVEFVDAELAIK